jgi:hypothetical protein
MRYQEMSRWRLAALIILCLFSLNGYANRDDDDEDDDEMDEVTAEELAMENIPVDERIFRVRWNEVPFDKRFFTYTDEQIEEKWDYLMRGLRIPFPSAEYMRAQSTKYPFIIEGIKDFDGDFDKLEKRYLSVWRKFKTLAAAVRLGYAYAIARIAEESPIPIVVARGYIGKIKNNSDHITDLVPDHPLGHAFRAGVDAGIMRRVGKFTGRMTYNARSTVVGSSFGKARKLTPDIPIVAYEHGNALIYMNRNRNINEALALFEEASKMQPQFAMDALDTMYAHKRLQEVRLYTQNYRSFRKFEKDRRRFSRVTDRNLTNILSPVLTMDMLENPEKYKLAERR